jgi:hypothetical protein
MFKIVGGPCPPDPYPNLTKIDGLVALGWGNHIVKFWSDRTKDAGDMSKRSSCSQTLIWHVQKKYSTESACRLNSSTFWREYSL